MKMRKARCLGLLCLGMLAAWLWFGGYDYLRFLLLSQCPITPEFAGAAGARTNAVLTVDFSPDGKLVAAGTIDGVLAVWGTRRGDLRWIREVGEPVYCAQFAPHEDAVLACTFTGLRTDPPVGVWDAKTGKQLKSFGNRLNAHKLAISPNGRWVAFGAHKSVIVRNAQTGRTVVDLALAPSQYHEAVAFSPHGGVLAAGGGDYSAAGITWWDTSTWQALGKKRWECPEGSKAGDSGGLLGWLVHVLAYSPDGKWLAVAGESSRILLLDAQMREQRSLTAHNGWVTGLAFSPTGRLLVSGGSDGAVKVWEVRTGRCVRVMRRHWGEVREVAVSRNGTLAASAGDDATVRLWRLRTGRCVRILRPPWAPSKGMPGQPRRN